MSTVDAELAALERERAARERRLRALQEWLDGPERLAAEEAECGERRERALQRVVDGLDSLREQFAAQEADDVQALEALERQLEGIEERESDEVNAAWEAELAKARDLYATQEITWAAELGLEPGVAPDRLEQERDAAKEALAAVEANIARLRARAEPSKPAPTLEAAEDEVLEVVALQDAEGDTSTIAADEPIHQFDERLEEFERLLQLVTSPTRAGPDPQQQQKVQALAEQVAKMRASVQVMKLHAPSDGYEDVPTEQLPALPSAPPPISDKAAYKDYMRLRYEYQRRGLLPDERPATPSVALKTSTASAADSSPGGYETLKNDELPPLPPASPSMANRTAYKDYMRLRYEYQRRGLLDEGPAATDSKRPASALPQGVTTSPPTSRRPSDTAVPIPTSPRTPHSPRASEVNYSNLSDAELPALPAQPPPLADKIAYKNFMRLRYEYQERGLLPEASGTATGSNVSPRKSVQMPDAGISPRKSSETGGSNASLRRSGDGGTSTVSPRKSLMSSDGGGVSPRRSAQSSDGVSSISPRKSQQGADAAVVSPRKESRGLLGRESIRAVSSSALPNAVSPRGTKATVPISSPQPKRSGNRTDASAGSGATSPPRVASPTLGRKKAPEEPGSPRVTSPPTLKRGVSFFGGQSSAASSDEPEAERSIFSKLLSRESRASQAPAAEDRSSGGTSKLNVSAPVLVNTTGFRSSSRVPPAAADAVVSPSLGRATVSPAAATPVAATPVAAAPVAATPVSTSDTSPTSSTPATPTPAPASASNSSPTTSASASASAAAVTTTNTTSSPVASMRSAHKPLPSPRPNKALPPPPFPVGHYVEALFEEDEFFYVARVCEWLSAKQCSVEFSESVCFGVSQVCDETQLHALRKQPRYVQGDAVLVANEDGDFETEATVEKIGLNAARAQFTYQVRVTHSGRLRTCAELELCSTGEVSTSPAPAEEEPPAAEAVPSIARMSVMIDNLEAEFSKFFDEELGLKK